MAQCLKKVERQKMKINSFKNATWSTSRGTRARGSTPSPFTTSALNDVNATQQNWERGANYKKTYLICI